VHLEEEKCLSSVRIDRDGESRLKQESHRDADDETDHKGAVAETHAISNPAHSRTNPGTYFKETYTFTDKVPDDKAPDESSTSTITITKYCTAPFE
jgi:hypothetical protein